MRGARVAILVWLRAVATAALRPAGTAPYSNATSIATSPSPAQTLSPTQRPPYPISGSGTITHDHGVPRPTEQGSVKPPLSINTTTTSDTNSTTTDSSCTVNIPDAQFRWWYAATYEYPVGTLTLIAPNFTNDGQFLTLIPNTATFDVSSAISSDEAWTESVYYNTEYDMDWTQFEPYSVTPTAASTSLVVRDNAPPLPSGNIIPVTDSMLYLPVTAPLPASVAFAVAANVTSAITSATPFLYVTAYEVESAVNGSTTTETSNLAQPSAFEYPVKGIENSASATGIVPEGFLHQIPESICSPGTVQGAVTVLVVLDLYRLHRPPTNPFLVHFESTADGFEDTSDVVNVQGTSKGTPFTVGWDFPASGAAGVETNVQSKPGAQQSAPPPVPTRINLGPGPGTQSAPPPVSTKHNAGPEPAVTQLAPTPPSTNGDGNQNAPGGPIDAPQPTQHTVGSVGANPIVVGPSSVVVVGTHTLAAGKPATTINGTPISLAPSATAIVVGGTTSALPIVADPASRSQTVGTIRGTPIVIGPSSVVIVGSQTLQPGGPIVTIGGKPVWVAPSASAIIVGSKTSVLPHVIFPESPQSQAAAPPVLTIGSLTVTANAATQYFVKSGQTLTPGGTIIFDGTVVSLAPSASFVVVGGSTHLISEGLSADPTAQPMIVVGGSTITALPGSRGKAHENNNLSPDSPENVDLSPTFVVSGQTLAPGHTITVDGTVIALPSSGSVVVINGVTSTVLGAFAAQITPPPLTIGNSVYSALSGSDITYKIGTAFLTPNDVITVDGTTISLAPGATALVVNGATTTLEPTPQLAITSPPDLTIGSHTYTAAPGSGTSFVIDGQTLTPSGTITVDGTTISLSPGATALVVNGKTTTLQQIPQPAITSPPDLTIGSHTYTASPGSGTSFVIDGQTLTPGGTITEDGTTIVLAPGATQLTYGSSGQTTTVTLFPATRTRSQSIVATASAPASAGASGSNGEAAATTSARGAGSRNTVFEAWVVTLVVGLVCLLVH